jgi:uncharacterized damage-inducible protein DinB
LQAQIGYNRAMKVRSINLLSVALIAAASAMTVAAQDAPKGFRASFLGQLKDVETKYVNLAQAIPQEKYTWPPGEGVRSVSEVFLHLAFANFNIPNFVGVKAPAGIGTDMKTMETSTTDKEKIIETLKASFAHVRKVAMDMPDKDLDKATKVFGRDSDYRGVLFLIANHMHEHLGQLIAYARMNGVVPPWST